jgi:hypothetical protein
VQTHHIVTRFERDHTGFAAIVTSEPDHEPPPLVVVTALTVLAS